MSEAEKVARDADSATAELDDDLAAIRRLAGTGTASPEEPAAAEIDALRGGVEALLARERGPLAALRARPSGQRLALVLGATAVVVLGSYALAPRSDLADYPAGHMIFNLAVLGLLTMAAAWRLLRPVHLPPLPAWTGRALLIVAVVTPALLALVPLEHAGAPAGQGAQFALACARCLGFGAAMGAPALVLGLLARRARMDGAAVAALAGVVAGLTGNLALALHCPVSEPLHVILGHGTLLVLLAVVAAWGR
jgi:hypothetical protein